MRPGAIRAGQHQIKNICPAVAVDISHAAAVGRIRRGALNIAGNPARRSAQHRDLIQRIVDSVALHKIKKPAACRRRS